MLLRRKYKIFKLLGNKPTNLTEEGFVYFDDILSRLEIYKEATNTYYLINDYVYIINHSNEFFVQYKGFIEILITEYEFDLDDLWHLIGYVFYNLYKPLDSFKVTIDKSCEMRILKKLIEIENVNNQKA